MKSKDIHPVVFCRNPRFAEVVNSANLAAAAYQDADLNEQFREVKKAQNCADELNRENKKISACTDKQGG